MKRWRSILVASIAFFWGRSAHAQTPEQLYERAWAAMDRKAFEEACALFETSYEASRATGPLQGLAACQEARGRLKESLDLWREALRIVPAKSASAAQARSAIARLESRVPKLTIRLTQEGADGATVELDGEVVEVGSPRPVEPVIEHVVRVSAPDRREAGVRLRLTEGERRTIVVSPGAGVGDEDAGIGPVRATGIALLTLGGVGLTAAAVTGGVMLSEEAAIDRGCPSDSRTGCSASALDASERATALAPWNVAAWVVGVAATGAGLPMVVVGDAEGDLPNAALSVGPTGASVAVSF